MIRKRDVRESVIVIVGASSGVGRATAVALANRGARLVLAARSEAALASTVDECRAAGTDARAVVVDVTDPEAPERLLVCALEAYGRVDVWINLAAGLIAGEFGTEPVAEVDQLVRTNLLGTVYADRAALRYFRAEGRGVLINVASMLGVVPNPLVPLYTMTKFGLRGLSLALHHLAEPWGVEVCVILPGPIDTPLFQRAANHTGRELRPIPPALAPDRVAAAIVRCVRRPRQQVAVGWSSYVILLGLRVVPRTTEWAVARWSGTLVLAPGAASSTAGTLFEPGASSGVQGGWRRGRIRRVLGDRIGRAIAHNA